MLLFVSCHGNGSSWWSDDTSGAREEIFRYDRLVDEYVSLNSIVSLQRMNMEYPVPTRLLIEEVLSVGSVQTPHIEQRLREYYLDSVMQMLLEDVHREYPSLDAEEKEIFTVFHQVKRYDSEFRIPFVYSQMSGLNQSIIVGDSLLGISLDKYLGRDYPLYHRYYYDWQIRGMGRDRLVPDALFYYLSHEYPLPVDSVHTLLDYIADYGKWHWIIARLRGVDLMQEMGFDEERIEGYKRNEAVVWNWLNECGRLTSSEHIFIRRFLLRRGDTPSVGDRCPDRIGLWMGLQMVDHYMASHPDVTIGELIHDTDYRRMLRESGYNPSLKNE